MASFELVLFGELLLEEKVTCPEATGWSGVSEKGCGKTNGLQSRNKIVISWFAYQNHCSWEGCWVAETTDSQFSKPSGSQNLVSTLALYQLHPAPSSQLQPQCLTNQKKNLTHKTLNRHHLVTQQGYGLAFRYLFEPDFLVQKWFWADSVFCPELLLLERVAITIGARDMGLGSG